MLIAVAVVAFPVVAFPLEQALGWITINKISEKSFREAERVWIAINDQQSTIKGILKNGMMNDE